MSSLANLTKEQIERYFTSHQCVEIYFAGQIFQEVLDTPINETFVKHAQRYVQYMFNGSEVNCIVDCIDIKNLKHFQDGDEKKIWNKRMAIRSSPSNRLSTSQDVAQGM